MRRIFVIFLTTLLFSPVAPVHAQEDISFSDLMNEWRRVRGVTWQAQGDFDTAARKERDAFTKVQKSQERLKVLEADFQREKHLSSLYVVDSYMRLNEPQGMRQQLVTEQLVHSRFSLYQDAKEALERGEEQLEKNRVFLGERTRERERARDVLNEKEQDLEDITKTIRESAGSRDISPVAVDAYSTVADIFSEAYPDCRLSAAILAGVGRVTSNHGTSQLASISYLGDVDIRIRGPVLGPDSDNGTLDGDPRADRAIGPMLVSPAHWTFLGFDANESGDASPDNLYDSAGVIAALLCARERDVLTVDGLSEALTDVNPDPVWGERVWASALMYARADIGLGDVPTRPYRSSTALGFDPAEKLPDGDVIAMMFWAASKVGVPYSQCIGRPQDPVCPPGTNRFGSGFFDCSGFVAAAYARIGVGVPLTTYLMEADAEFMATKVSDRIDVDLMVPGDVMLMDGHVALYFGDGRIIHSSTGGVQIEPVPAYMWREVFAILRPVGTPPR